MHNIIIINLSFGYDHTQIFDNVNLNINSSWKLGITGRNGQGKSTLFKILLNQLEYEGTITTSLQIASFPLQNIKAMQTVNNLIETYIEYGEEWKVSRELTKLGINEYVGERLFESLSGGEQTKVMLAILFTIPNCFLLIDEPTNHLDSTGRVQVSNYLNSKSGYLLISHDLDFLDQTIDHVLAIERNQLNLYKSSMSEYLNNKEIIDNQNRLANNQIRKEIKRLEAASKRTANWSEQKEASKVGEKNRDGKPDRGYVGHKAAKLMKRSKTIEARVNQNISDKQSLLKNIDVARSITIQPLTSTKPLISAYNIDVTINGNKLISDLSFEINSGNIYKLNGVNGSGKTTLLNILASKQQAASGTITYLSNLKLSTISQDQIDYDGSVADYCNDYNLDLTLVSTILINLGIEREALATNINSLSHGQNKKLAIAISISAPAHLYIWDEPLNYLDIIARTQIINLIKENKMALLVVEHDNNFATNLETIDINL